MALVAVPVNSGAPTDGFSLPNMVSFAVSADGGGGDNDIEVNGVGETAATTGVATCLDLKTYFLAGGVNFVSYPLLRAFRRILPAASATLVERQLVNNLDINVYSLSGPATDMPGFSLSVYGIGTGNPNTPYLVIQGPNVAGLWRVELKLRHTITN